MRVHTFFTFPPMVLASVLVDDFGDEVLLHAIEGEGADQTIMQALDFAMNGGAYPEIEEGELH